MDFMSLCRLVSYSRAEMPGVRSFSFTRRKRMRMLLKRESLLTEVGVRSKDRLTKFCRFSRDGRTSPDESWKHKRMSYLRPSSGFHPTFVSCISLPSLPPSCSLHALYSLPPLLFVDPNELTQDHDLRTAVDLESPAFNLDQRPTRILYNITKNTAHFHPNGSVCFSLPMHARYGTPSTSRVHPLSIECPQVFSSCPQSRMSNSPARRTLNHDVPR